MMLRKAYSPRSFGYIKEAENQITLSNLLAGSHVCREFTAPC